MSGGASLSGGPTTVFQLQLKHSRAYTQAFTSATLSH